MSRDRRRVRRAAPKPVNVHVPTCGRQVAPPPLLRRSRHSSRPPRCAHAERLRPRRARAGRRRHVHVVRPRTASATLTRRGSRSVCRHRGLTGSSVAAPGSRSSARCSSRSSACASRCSSLAQAWATTSSRPRRSRAATLLCALRSLRSQTISGSPSSRLPTACAWPVRSTRTSCRHQPATTSERRSATSARPPGRAS